MEKRFIVLIDFSEYSANLLRYAYHWSLQVDATLMLVHQVDVLAPALTDNISKTMLAQQANAHALEKLKDFGRSLLPLTTETAYYASHESLPNILSQLLLQPYNHLVFVGLKGTRLLKKIFLGSVAVEIIEHTRNAVVAIPADLSQFIPDKIFVAVSNEHPVNTLELNNFLKLVKTNIESITFFSLVRPREKTEEIEETLNQLASLFSGRYNTSVTIYRGSRSFPDIKQVINNRIEELLVVQKGSRLLTDQLFRRFVINELVYHGQTPLVVLP